MIKLENGKMTIIDGEEENKELCRIFKCPPGTEEELSVVRHCPICGAVYTEPPAISRKDNKTAMCPDCGTLEALESIGASEELKIEILNTIWNARKGAFI